MQRKKLDLQQVADARLCAEESLKEGLVIGGNYRIIEKIGQGGMGLVLRVAHKVIGKHYALKVLSPEVITAETWLRFQSEARTMGALSHPTFVKVYDLGLHNDLLPFYAMELVNGVSLESEIIERGHLLEEDTIAIFLQVLDGLAYAHRHGVIHRDLKPSNIMLCSRDVNGKRNSELDVKILDFGIAKSGNANSYDAQALTRIGDIFGSPCYMSPEQAMGRKVDARSDIYSIGCSIFESLTGYVPFDGVSASEICNLHQSAPPPTLSEMGAGQFSASIEYVVRKCLAKLPADRYQSAKELALDLQRLQEGKNVFPYRKKTLLATQSSEVRPLGAVRILAALSLCAGLAAILYFNVRFRQTQTTASERPPVIQALAPERAAVTGLGLNDLSSTLSLGADALVRRAKGKARLLCRENNTISEISSPPPPGSGTYTLAPIDAGFDYVSRLKGLRIVGLQLSTLLSAAADVSDTSSGVERVIFAEPAEVRSFCAKVGPTLQISELTILAREGICKDIVQDFPNLDTLILHSIELDELAGPEDRRFLLAHLKHLQLLAMHSDGGSVAAMGNARELRSLRWELPELGANSIAAIASIKGLQSVDIKTGLISQSALHDVLGLPCLTKLSVNYRPGIFGELLSSIKPARTLDLTICGVDPTSQGMQADWKSLSGCKLQVHFVKKRIGQDFN